MHKRYLFAGYRLFFGLLTVSALTVQFINGFARPSFDILNFFSFFTIQSNIVAAALFIIAAFLTLKDRQSDTLSILRGAATLYMVTTGIVYVLLLAGLEESLQTTIPWVNAVLHYIMPIAVLADWFIDIPKRRMQFNRALIWLAFPLGYVAYSLVRGAMAGWYPYPFLNPAENGYGVVFVISVCIAAGMTGMIWLITWTTKLAYAKK